MKQKTEFKSMVVTESNTDKPDFNCLEYNSLNSPCFSVLICWKFEFKQSLMLNYLTRNGYSCITAILMRVLLVCRTLPKDKHSCRIVQM